MNNYQQQPNGSQNMQPLMVMPNGQVIFWQQPENHCDTPCEEQNAENRVTRFLSRLIERISLF